MEDSMSISSLGIEQTLFDNQTDYCLENELPGNDDEPVDVTLIEQEYFQIEKYNLNSYFYQKITLMEFEELVGLYLVW
jgi:hypothetical protein